MQRKAKRGQPLSACPKRRNKRIAQVRARVEHVFACLRATHRQAGLHHMGKQEVQLGPDAVSDHHKADGVQPQALGESAQVRDCGLLNMLRCPNGGI